MPTATSTITPDKLMHTATAFWQSKVLLTAVELGLFTELEKTPGTKEEIAKRLSLNPRSVADFLDCLVSMGFLQRDGALYSNAAETAMFLDAAKPTYIGGFVNMLNTRLYKFWDGLTDGLKTGTVQNEAKDDPDLFTKLCADPTALKAFLEAMTGLSSGAAKGIASKFNFAAHENFMDVGCAQGGATVAIAAAFPSVKGIGYDLPAVGPIFDQYVQTHNLSDRVSFVPGNFFKEELPKASVILMGHILHDWDLEQKIMLVEKAYRALPKGGALLVYDAMIDDDRRENTFGLLMSLNMLIETPGGFDYTTADCRRWLNKAGFANVTFEPLSRSHTLAIAIK